MNIAQHVERAARWLPAHPAIMFEGAPIPYADLNARVNRLANALTAHGVGAGDRVGLFLPNIPEFLICYLAALKIGAIAVSINAILPLFHVFGQNFIMNAALTACATLVLHRRFIPDQVLDSIRRDRITMFFGVPTIFITLLNMDLSGHDLSSIRYEFSAAATMPQEISRRWTDRFGRPVYEGYGLTECSPFACYNHDFRHKFGSVGTAVENTELRIVDPDDQPLPPGEWGEIVIRGPGVMKGYWNKPEDTAEALRGGWLHSGDIGTLDDEGYIFIVDRLKDMINVAGFKVWPAEVEQVLYRHPAIQETAVYGAPDPLKGESVRAAIILKHGVTATADEIQAYCRDRMAAYKVPAAIDIVRELPKSATGKILKRVLRAQSPR